MSTVARAAAAGAPVLAIVFVATHVGAYPWIQETPFYGGLATFVAVNTLAFAMLAALKLSYRLGKQSTSHRDLPPVLASVAQPGEGRKSMSKHRSEDCPHV